MAPEFKLDAPGVDGAGEIEQVGFNGEGSAVEGGAHADVGDGAAGAGFALEQRTRDVNAARGQEVLLGLEIERRKGEPRTGAGAGDDGTGERVRTAEETGGAVDAACGDFAADGGAGDDFAAAGDGRDDSDFEAEA